MLSELLKASVLLLWGGLLLTPRGGSHPRGISAAQIGDGGGSYPKEQTPTSVVLVVFARF